MYEADNEYRKPQIFSEKNEEEKNEHQSSKYNLMNRCEILIVGQQMNKEPAVKTLHVEHEGLVEERKN